VKFLEQCIADTGIVRLLEKCLAAGILEMGSSWRNSFAKSSGAPQAESTDHCRVGKIAEHWIPCPRVLRQDR
jgi:hypothetical protein